MAGFCGKCGSPLDDAQAFCARCGTPVSGPPPGPAAATPAAPPAMHAPTASPAAPVKSSNTLLKVLLVFVIIIFVLGAVGIAGVWYVGHRIKQKVHDMGLDQVSSVANDHRGPALSVNPCSLLSKADVATATKMDIVRAETAEDSETTCEYSVMGNYVDLISKHISLLHKEETTDQQRQMVETFAKAIGHSNETDQNNPRHPGESPVLIFTVDNNNAAAQMSISRATLGNLGPGASSIPALGDDAFDIGNAFIMVRKGDRIIRIAYMMCPCTTDDVIPLAKKIVGNM